MSPDFSSLTIYIVIITGIVSYISFQKKAWLSKLQFNAYLIYHHKQWYRLLTHGFVHGSWMHLIINMIVLYSFGYVTEYFFGYKLELSVLNFLTLYIGGIIISSLTSLAKYKDDPTYNAVGASGAVSAVVFASIFFVPWQPVYLFAIIPIPGIIFGALYLGYSQYMSKKGKDNINHEAHFVGAIYGFIYPVLMNPPLIKEFLYKLTSI
jgi:membrane associated rhomboid family serine protease